MQKPTPPFLHINLSALHHNLESLCRRAGVPIDACIPVIKNSAYGLGSKIISQKMQEWGVRKFAVATLEEALFLRTSGIRGEIIILGRVEPEGFTAAKKNDLTLSLIDPSQITCLHSFNGKISLNIDTGMHRCGIRDDEIRKFFPGLKKLSAKITSVYTHFHSADDAEKEKTLRQQKRFRIALDVLKNAHIENTETHCSNSAGTLFFGSCGCSHIRPGISLLGCSPDPHISLEDSKPVASIISAVCSVRRVKKNEGVSYGQTWKAEKDTRIATFPLGYADGFPRTLSGQDISVIIENTAHLPLAGRITMDYSMVDIGNAAVKPGDVVYITHTNQTIDDLACLCGTIGYELLCNVGYAMTKKYYEAGRCIAILPRSIF
ncbi:MAG: alanine racemase [Fibrobacterota bacterium]